MNTTTANITDNVKPTTQTSSFKMLLVAGAGILVLPFLIPILCNGLAHAGLFTLEDAETTKAFFGTAGKYFLTTIGVGGTVGTVGGSLTSRVAKYLGQLAPGIATAATPLGEGVGVGALAPAIGGDMAGHVPTGKFDITDYNIGAPTADEIASLPDTGNPNILEVTD